MEQMVSLIHVPLFVIESGTNGMSISAHYGSRECELDFYNENPDYFFSIKKHIDETSPCILTENNLNFAAIEVDKDRFFVLGPCVFLQSSFSNYDRKSYKNNEIGYEIAAIPFNELVSAVLLLNWQLTGEKLSSAKLLRNNQLFFDSTNDYKRTATRDFFENNENLFMHNPYDQELREVESIEKGNRKELTDSISETYTGEVGKLADDPLRSHKNVAIGNITLASRAAIRGGVSAEKSFSLADTLIQRLEKISNIPEVEAFKRESQFAFIGLVEEEKGNACSDTKKDSPLVQEVKDYIFAHLNNMIEVADIADELDMNADYLSHHFSMQEGITISEYVRREKVMRAQNLLKYSDYKIKEIAYYLGFSSQSHFSRVFKDISFITPNEYRRKFKDRTAWKNK